MGKKPIRLGVLSLMLLIGSLCISFADTIEGQLKISLLDLTHWQFSEQGVYTFTNEWEFYPNRYIDSEDFLNNRNIGVKQFIQMPRSLYAQEAFQEKYKADYGTLRTQVDLPKESLGKELSIRSTLFYRDTQIFVNGKPLIHQDEPKGMWQRLRTMEPQMVGTFVPQSQHIEIIVHFSQKNTYGNSYGSLILGHSEQVTQSVVQRLMIDTFLLSALVILAIFNLVFFLRRNRREHGDKLPLYFLMLVAAMAIRILNSGEHYLLYFMPNMPGELMSKLGYWSYYLLLPLFVLFACEIRRDLLPPMLKKISLYAAGFFGLFVLMVDHRIYTQITWLYHLYFIAVMIQLILHMIRALQLRVAWFKVEFFAFLIIVLIFLLDSFYISGYYDLRSYYLLSILVFLVYVTVMISRVYANAVDRLENLTYSYDMLQIRNEEMKQGYELRLVEQNHQYSEALEAKEIRLASLENIAKELAGTMVILDRQLCIRTAYGSMVDKHLGHEFEGEKFLKYFYGDSTEAGQLFKDIMERVTRLEHSGRIATYLSLLPKRSFKQGKWYNLETRYIRLEDNAQPIFIVVITDVNKWIQSKQQLERVQMENVLLVNYIKHPANLKYLLMRLKDFSGTELDRLIEQAQSSDELIEKLIIQLERFCIWYEAFGFERTTVVFKAIIEELDRLSKEVIPISKEALVDIIRDYHLGQLDQEDRRVLASYVGDSLDISPEVHQASLREPRDLKEAFEVMRLYCDVLAKRYGKDLAPLILEVPHMPVSLEKSGHLLRSLTKIFEAIIVNNLEYYDERHKLGKPIESQIKVRVGRSLDVLEIIIEDDGAGVNINTLKDSLYKLSLLSFKEIVNASEQEILPFIFERDVYYKEADTTLGGIGDGLWRVKEALKRYGGSIQVESSYQHYCRFIIQIPLEVIDP